MYTKTQIQVIANNIHYIQSYTEVSIGVRLSVKPYSEDKDWLNFLFRTCAMCMEAYKL